MTYTGGRRWVLAKVESSYNTDPTLANPTDLKYVESFTFDPEDTTIARGGPSPYRQGFPPVQGPYKGPWTATVEIAPLSISGSGNTPECTVWLRACGFSAPTYSAGSTGVSPFTQTFDLLDEGHGSIYLEDYDANDAGTDGWKFEGGGARADWTLRISGPERWLLDLTGDTASGAITGTGSGKDSNTNYLNKVPAPVVGGANYIEFSDLSGALNYADATAYVHEITLNGNMAMTTKDTPMGREVELNPEGAVTGTLIVEQVDDGDWTPHAFQTARTPVLLRVASSDLGFATYTAADPDVSDSGAPTTSGNYVMLETTTYITSVTRSDNMGRKVWSIGVSSMYPFVDDGGGSDNDGGGRTPDTSLKVIFGTYAAS